MDCLTPESPYGFVRLSKHVERISLLERFKRSSGSEPIPLECSFVYISDDVVNFGSYKNNRDHRYAAS